MADKGGPSVVSGAGLFRRQEMPTGASKLCLAGAVALIAGRFHEWYGASSLVYRVTPGVLTSSLKSAIQG